MSERAGRQPGAVATSEGAFGGDEAATAAVGGSALRRRCVLAPLLLLTIVFPAAAHAKCLAPAPQRRFHDAAVAMRRLAESWGDQPYGAVLVLDERVVGEGPSRVVQRNDPSAHAEREAIRDAQHRLGRTALATTVLYSTSRPCGLCEAAAREAGVACLVFGERLEVVSLPSPR